MGTEALRVVVTGAAGFIGSSTVDRLLADGHDVVAIDNFCPYYSSEIKRANIESALSYDSFSFHAADLLDANLDSLLDGADVVLHLAAQPGVRRSWGGEFKQYTRNNVEATNSLVAASVARHVNKFVYASSSSVYGQATTTVTDESCLPIPFSPYGITKLAGEQLTHAYGANFDLTTVSLRYFTVYGPRQRPDMAFHRFFRALMAGDEIEIFGDGSQIRDFTYVADVVDATVSAALTSLPSGSVFNVAGGSRHGLLEALQSMREITRSTSPIRLGQAQPGDVTETAASVTSAADKLNWAPRVPLADGLVRQFEWHSSIATR